MKLNNKTNRKLNICLKDIIAGILMITIIVGIPFLMSGIVEASTRSAITDDQKSKIKGKKVFICPSTQRAREDGSVTGGSGSTDPWACDGTTIEGDYMQFTLAPLVMQKLQNLGIEPSTYKYSKTDAGNWDTHATIKSAGGEVDDDTDLLVALHSNAEPGQMYLYYTGNAKVEESKKAGEKIATFVNEYFKESTGKTTELRELSTKADNEFAYPGNFPRALIEVAGHVDKTESQWMKDDADGIATAIVDGIVSYFLGEDVTTGEASKSDASTDEIIVDYSKVVEVGGDEEKGYYLKFVDDIDKKLEDLFNERREMYVSIGVEDIDVFKQIIKAEVATAFPDLGGVVKTNIAGAIETEANKNDISNDINKFQGSVTLRRLTPSKEMGEFADELDSDTKTTPIENQKVEGRGTASELPVSVKMQIKQKSLQKQEKVDFSKLAYLEIPYLSFNEETGQDGDIKTGKMVVNKDLAEEVLDIFQKLYNNKYPIANMNLVESYYDQAKEIDLQSTSSSTNSSSTNSSSTNSSSTNSSSTNSSSSNDSKTTDTKTDSKTNNTNVSNEKVKDLKQESLDNNNTFAFCYDASRESTYTLHSTGNAIDINPMINPSVQNGKTTQYGAEKYVDRNSKDSWADAAKRAFIDTNSDIYKIFKEKGWTWEGEDTKNTNYGEFVKKTTEENSTEEEPIKSKLYTLSYVPESTFNSLVSSNDKKALYVFTLDSNMKIVTATWTYSNKTGLKIKKSDSISIRKALAKYAMPYELLSSMLSYSEDIDFVKGLAKLAMDSTYIVTIEDEVTTTKTIKSTTTNSDLYLTDTGERRSSSRSTDVDTTLEEKATQTPEVTYVDCWYVKYYLTGNSSSYFLQSKDFIKETEITVKGKVEKKENHTSNSKVIEVYEEHDNKHSITTIITYTDVYTRKYTYEKGDAHIGGNAEKFIDLYHKVNFTPSTVYIPWLAERLSKYPRTANMVDIIKYLFYQADNNNFDITIIKFEDYKPDDFKEATGGASSTGNLSTTGNSFEEKVWNAIKSMGYSDILAASIMGNIYGECDFDPASIESRGVGIGFIQWSYGRRDQFEAYVASKNADWKNVDVQIEFFIGELTGKGPAAGYASQRTMGYIREEGVPSSYDEWVSTTTIDDATLSFMRYFESPRNLSSYEKRKNQAQVYYDKYHK